MNDSAQTDWGESRPRAEPGASEGLVPEFHQGDPVNRYEHRRVAPCCSVMAREFLDTFGEPRTLAASPSSEGETP